jgi:ribosomal protein S18 acetylase RimI-like enzyme
VSWTSAELATLRSRVGESAALWAREVQIEEGRWKAFSGAFSPRYNLVLCHGPGLLGEAADEVAASGVPAMVMVAGAAAGEVSELEARDWVCAGEMPFMARDLRDRRASAAAPDVQRLTAAEALSGARALIADVFSLHDRLALVAMPADAAERPGNAVWGAFDESGALVSCVITVEVGEYLAIWSLATAPAARRRGHAARVMATALADAPARLRGSLLYAPVEAEMFYRSLGYEVLERWQLWARRKWRVV